MPAHKKDTVGSYVKNKEVVSFKPMQHPFEPDKYTWTCSCKGRGVWYVNLHKAALNWQEHVARMHPDYET